MQVVIIIGKLGFFPLYRYQFKIYIGDGHLQDTDIIQWITEAQYEVSCLNINIIL